MLVIFSATKKIKVDNVTGCIPSDNNIQVYTQRIKWHINLKATGSNEWACGALCMLLNAAEDHGDCCSRLTAVCKDHVEADKMHFHLLCQVHPAGRARRT